MRKFIAASLFHSDVRFKLVLLAVMLVGGFPTFSQNKKVGLGHRRLSIIDISPLGHQPMNYMNRYWIVFNGEIYNFQEKKDFLLKDGYTFKSKSDTEVIMAL